MQPTTGVEDEEHGDLKAPTNNADVYWNDKHRYYVDNGQTKASRNVSPEDESCEEKAEKKSPKRWKKALYEFSQNTTLQGLNKITEEQPYITRR